ncbi:MAG TPA: hypothetical protein VMJ10_11545, partial [Kofleriaceae bacterium]|nr:hypothetical protein [Kofleriaceae bacterium]
TGATQTLTLHNTGTMALAVQVDSAPPGVTAAPITIAPGQDGQLQVTAADPSSLAGSLVLATNDPSHASVDVALDPDKSGETTMSPDHEDSGCNASGGGNGLALIALGLGVCCARARGARARRR